MRKSLECQNQKLQEEITEKEEEDGSLKACNTKPT